MAQRRRFLKFFVSLIVWAPLPGLARLRATRGEPERAQLMALAEVVLPRGIRDAGRRRAADAFGQWLRDYREGAELDHGYGLTSLNRAPPSPAFRYAQQFADLDRRCGGRFAAASYAARLAAVTQALQHAKAAVLPALPDGAHVATDLMAHFFNGPEANDLVHGRVIGRFSCRGLAGSERPPPRMDGAGSTP